jgi:hypothetical protein
MTIRHQKNKKLLEWTPSHRLMTNRHDSFFQVKLLFRGYLPFFAVCHRVVPFALVGLHR